MAIKTAEDSVKNCHRCNNEFDKKNVRIPTPIRDGEPNHFWFLCLDCFQEEGGVWWIKNRVRNLQREA